MADDGVGSTGAAGAQDVPGGDACSELAREILTKAASLSSLDIAGILLTGSVPVEHRVSLAVILRRDAFLVLLAPLVADDIRNGLVGECVAASRVDRHHWLVEDEIEITCSVLIQATSANAWIASVIRLLNVAMQMRGRQRYVGPEAEFIRHPTGWELRATLSLLPGAAPGNTQCEN